MTSKLVTLLGNCTSITGSIALFSTAITSSSATAAEYMLQPQYTIQSHTKYAGILSMATESPALSFQKIISHLHEEGIPISAIAECARVERKSIYSWLKGGVVRAENQSRLETIYNLLIENKRSSLLYLYRYWNQSVGHNSTLRSLLKEDSLNFTAIKKALLKLWPLAENYQNELSRSYLEANNDTGQQEAITDWHGAIADGSDDW